MAFNGSGVFSRTNGTNTGATLWADDRDASAKILADRHDIHDQDLADGLSLCIARDGQSTISANIPMNSKKFTGLTTGSARTDSISLGQAQDAAYTIGGTTGGSANAYTASLSPAITAYANGQIIQCVIHAANTATSTLNVNGVAAETIKKFNSAGTTTALVSGDMPINWPAIFRRAGGEWILLNPCRPYITNARFSGLTASRYIQTDSNKDLVSKTSAEVLDDLFAISTWTPLLAGDGAMTTTSKVVHEANYTDAGGWIFFELSVSCTLGGTASAIIYISEPVAGSGHDANVAFTCTGNENGVGIGDLRWRYDGSNFIVFKAGLTNFTLGANANIAITGKYRAA